MHAELLACMCAWMPAWMHGCTDIWMYVCTASSYLRQTSSQSLRGFRVSVSFDVEQKKFSEDCG